MNRFFQIESKFVSKVLHQRFLGGQRSIYSIHFKNYDNKNVDNVESVLHLDPSQMAALGAVSYCVAGSLMDPLKDQPVVLQHELYLDKEVSVGRHSENVLK
jgi:hypothetical protein